MQPALSRTLPRGAVQSMAFSVYNSKYMQIRIRVAAKIIALLLLLLANLAHGQNPQPPQQNPTTSQSPQVLQQTRQLLDWFGVLALLEQAPLALTASLEAETKFRQATPQQRDGWRRELEPKLKSSSLQQALIRYVAERYRQDVFQRAEELLQQPLAKRARFFELAMTQASAAQGLQDFRAQLRVDPQLNRRTVVQELDAATATSLLAAILQTCIGERVRQVAEADGKVLSPAQEFVERQRFLAPLSEDYLLYTYRYFKDDELMEYRDLMRDAQLQWLLDVCRQGLIAVLQGAD